MSMPGPPAEGSRTQVAGATVVDSNAWGYFG